MRLSTRLALAMVLLVVLTAGAVGYLSYRNIGQAFLPTELTRLDSRARLQAANLNGHVSIARADVIALAKAPAVVGIVIARASGGRDPRDGTSEKVWRQRLAELFEAQLAAKPEYAQFRLIGGSDGGREIVRTDRSGPNNGIRVVPDAELQQKGAREYFKEALGRREGEVYLSQVGLDQENGVIETPHVPVTRVATPVMDETGKPFGILIINVDMRSAFVDIARSVTESGQVYVVNQDGDYLLHPDTSREFGFDLGKRYRVGDDFPDIGKALVSGEALSRMVRNAQGLDIAAALVPFRLADGPLIGIIETIPIEKAMASAAGVQRATLFGGLAAVLGATALAILLARSLSRPLMQMADWVSRFTGEEEMKVPADTKGEVGILARAFSRMTATVHEKTVALHREVEERGRTEALAREIAERERIYVSTVESAADAIITSTLDGFITTWNGGAKRLFGYTPKEAVGQPISLIAPPERRPEQFENLQRLRRGERIEDVDTVRVAADGTLRDVSLTLSPIADTEGTLVGVSAIYRDITPRKQAEERFRLAVEASPGGMIMVNKDGIITLANAEAARMFGYDKAELTGKPVELLIPEQLRANHKRDRTAYVANPLPRMMGAGRDLFGLRKDGSEIAVEIGINPIETREGPIVMAAIVDISERNRQQRLLAERAEELERSNAELEQFAYVASHDLQEPLRMVASYAELLAERYKGKLDEKADKYIGYAVDGAKRMQRLVNDLLAYSRVGRRTGTTKSTDTKKVVQDVLGSLRQAVDAAKAKIELELLPVVVTDDGQLAQVFQNLIGNSLKFKAADRPVEIRVGAKPTPQGWLFSVADNGIGIESQYSERIFQMFQRLHERQAYEGNGIGLTITKKIVERQGGRIWFESEPGRGTTFFFTLPQDQEKAA